jgi:hypothetical protein
MQRTTTPLVGDSCDIAVFIPVKTGAGVEPLTGSEAPILLLAFDVLTDMTTAIPI